MQTRQITTARRDFISINSNDPNELIYLQRQFPKKTSTEIKDAIKKFGPLRENIVAQLDKIDASGEEALNDK